VPENTETVSTFKLTLVSLVIAHLQHITYVHRQLEVNVKLSTAWFIRPLGVSVPTCHSTYTARQMACWQQIHVIFMVLQTTMLQKSHMQFTQPAYTLPIDTAMGILCYSHLHALTINKSSNICTLWYTIYDIYQLNCWWRQFHTSMHIRTCLTIFHSTNYLHLLFLSDRYTWHFNDIFTFTWTHCTSLLSDMRLLF
jgi:hypothetical protein